MSFPINEIDIWDLKAILEALSPDDPIENLAGFLECYDTSKPATITVYANQPVKNSPIPFSLDENNDPNPGHAFISISQDGNTSTFGFYPEADGIKALAPSTSVIGNNGGDSYDISISKTVSGSVLSKILDKAKSYQSKYDISFYNCTDYARDLGNVAGMNIPNAWGIYPGAGGGGQNPGKLGQVIRKMNVSLDIKIDRNGGNAPLKTQGCNK